MTALNNDEIKFKLKQIVEKAQSGDIELEMWENYFIEMVLSHNGKVNYYERSHSRLLIRKYLNEGKVYRG